MEGRIFQYLSSTVRQLGKTHSFKGKQFSDATIVITYLWAVLWDRPTHWACRRENWPKSLELLRLPSASTMSRRLRSLGVLSLIEQAQSALIELFPSGLCKLIDSKPLTVSAYSKDRDARVGHGAGFAARGYKFHAIVDACSRMPQQWTLAPMNRHDGAIAEQVLRLMPSAQAAYLVGDNAYDSNTLHDVAAGKACQLLAPRRPSAKGLGRHRHSAHRLAGLARLAHPLRCTGQTHSFGDAMLACRIGIEQSFAYMGNIACGLKGLPNWVRRPRRVALWIAGKLLIIAASRLIKNDLRKS